MNVIELKQPVSRGERTIHELTLQEPKVRHMLRTDGKEITTIGADIALLSALSGESEKILEEISLEDWALIRPELAKVYARFYGIDPEKLQNAGNDNEEEGQAKENPPAAAR